MASIGSNGVDFISCDWRCGLFDLRFSDKRPAYLVPYSAAVHWILLAGFGARAAGETQRTLDCFVGGNCLDFPLFCSAEFLFIGKYSTNSDAYGGAGSNLPLGLCRSDLALPEESSPGGGLDLLAGGAHAASGKQLVDPSVKGTA